MSNHAQVKISASTNDNAQVASSQLHGNCMETKGTGQVSAHPSEVEELSQKQRVKHTPRSGRRHSSSRQ
eukprot:2136132-Amphidinium_carterae.1